MTDCQTASEEGGRLPAIVSIHDVTPGTLQRTLDILSLLDSQGIHTSTLLVVPDTGWAEGDLDVLRRLQESGHELAGHGWTHQCQGIRSWKHRIHSLLVSRDMAEHLSFDSEQIAERIGKCHDWFSGARLPQPALYVPPAWAMGSVSRDVLGKMPFEMYEFLSGVYHVHKRVFTKLPLVGYEADTRLRQLSLRVSNAANSALRVILGKPLRVAIHPFDLDYHLANDLRRLLSFPIRAMRYSDIEAFSP